MKEFAKSKDVQLGTTAPYHPNNNPAERFMKTLGKAPKIGNNNKEEETVTRKAILKTYRQTPHPASNIPPASMIFRDAVHTCSSRQSFSE